ncbi:MAG: ABC transporter permease [Lysobacter sp.]|nr:ABC transporter permease [Lysobacter sp.]
MQAHAAANAFRFGSKFKLLLRREFWENKGGFFWAPIVTGIIACTFALIAMIGGSIVLNKSNLHGDSMQWDGTGPHPFGTAGDALLLVGIGLALLVMVFVVFFYALGSLYDERRDRSVLFWKSLPVSDIQVVLSKAAWALCLAPVMAVLIGVVIGIVIWIMAAIALTLNGIGGASAFFTDSHPLHVIGQVLAVLPLYALWALPAVGWLMLCSAWARRFPFLWAVLVPLLGCAMVSMSGGIFSAISGVDFPHGPIWYVVVLRGLASVMPGTWYANDAVDAERIVTMSAPSDVPTHFNLLSGWSAVGTMDLWLGVAAGIAMIFLAIRLRRWRDEG